MQFTEGNRIELLRNGAEYFPALMIAIEQAKHEVYLQTYIYRVDATGIQIGHALKQAALRGVTVNLLLDGFGCKDLPQAFIAILNESGVRVMKYRPKVSVWTFQKRRLRRMHRKIAVIDGSIAFVGGINLMDDIDHPEQTLPRIDYAVRLEGPILLPIFDAVHKLWHRMARDRQYASLIKPNIVAHSDGLSAALVMRDNVLHRHDIEKAYLSAIANAKIEIVIANAYFLPSRRFRKALLAAAARGVKIKLLLQGRREYILMFSTNAFYHLFLSHGIEIFEYRISFMHSKVAIIDREWATVGSSNIDPFSLLLANEANVVVVDKTFANALQVEVMLSIDQAYQVTLEEWTHSSPIKRFFSWIVYGVVRVFLELIGYKHESSNS
jgi:cardiolipin synthase A/B